MAETSFVRARIDEALKQEAAAVLADLGLTVSDVVRMTLTRIAKDGALPLGLTQLPNAETRAAMSEARLMMKKAPEAFDDAETIMKALESDG